MNWVFFIGQHWWLMVQNFVNGGTKYRVLVALLRFLRLAAVCFKVNFDSS